MVFPSWPWPNPFSPPPAPATPPAPGATPEPMPPTPPTSASTSASAPPSSATFPLSANARVVDAQGNTYRIARTFAYPIAPVTIGAGVLLQLTAAPPLLGYFAITKVTFDAATNTAGLVAATVYVNNDTPFQEPSVPILIWWPRVVVDLVEHGGGAYFVPAAQAISFAVTFANTSAIDQSVGTTFTLVQLQPEAGQ